MWERVAETRRAGLEAFERLAPNAVVASPAFAAAVARDEIARLLRTAKDWRARERRRRRKIW